MKFLVSNILVTSLSADFCPGDTFELFPCEYAFAFHSLREKAYYSGSFQTLLSTAGPTAHLSFALGLSFKISICGYKIPDSSLFGKWQSRQSFPFIFGHVVGYSKV